MSALSILPKRPLCLNCIRHSIGENGPQSLYPVFSQLRGKKKMAKKPDTINVRLLVDMKGYGRRGVITPVAPGRMRNAWYPRQQAEYVSTLRDLDPKEVVAERDFTFMMQDPSQTKEEPQASISPVIETPAPKAKTKLLTPQIATEILSERLPAKLPFYRTVIVEPEPEKALETPIPQSRRAASLAAAETYAASEPAPVEPAGPSVLGLRKIFGSVSTADIADSIKTLLTDDADGRRVVIGPEDISILGETGEDTGIEVDRLKALGEFPIEIHVKGGERVRRIVSVMAP